MALTPTSRWATAAWRTATGAIRAKWRSGPTRYCCWGLGSGATTVGTRSCAGSATNAGMSGMPQSVSTLAPSPSKAAAEPTSASTDVQPSVMAWRWWNTAVSKSRTSRRRPAIPPCALQYAANACIASQLERNPARAPVTSATTPTVIASAATPISSDAPAVPGPHGDTVGTRAVDTATIEAVVALGVAVDPHAAATSATAASAPKTRPRPRVARDVPISDPVPSLSSSRPGTGDPPGMALRAVHSRPQTGQSQARRPAENADGGGRRSVWRPARSVATVTAARVTT